QLATRGSFRAQKITSQRRPSTAGLAARLHVLRFRLAMRVHARREKEPWIAYSLKLSREYRNVPCAKDAQERAEWGLGSWRDGHQYCPRYAHATHAKQLHHGLALRLFPSGSDATRRREQHQMGGPVDRSNAPTASRTELNPARGKLGLRLQKDARRHRNRRSRRSRRPRLRLPRHRQCRIFQKPLLPTLLARAQLLR